VKDQGQTVKKTRHSRDVHAKLAPHGKF